MSRALALVGAGLLLLSAPAGARAQSLYRDGGVGGMLFVDHRARGVNDIVTILIAEQSSTSTDAKTELSKDQTRTTNVNQAPTLLDMIARRTVKWAIKPLLGWQTPSQIAENDTHQDSSDHSKHTGEGKIDRTAKTTGQITARVVKVLDNGNMVVEGRRSVIVNGETEVITLSGVVRPEDITSNNTVFSSQLADAEIQMVGRGVATEAQNPGIIYRFLDWIGLF